MSEEQFVRTELLLGHAAVEKLHHARVAVFGIGGVGGFAAEALARSGVGHLELIDSDTVCESNINRQIIATHRTVGRYKTEVMRERIAEINPEAEVVVHNCFFLPENAQDFLFESYDYVIDAVDTVTAKIELVMRAQECQTPIISCMGAGNKLDPTQFRVADIYKTSVCPLAKVMRHELKKRGVKKLKVVYSEELPAACGARAEGGADSMQETAVTGSARRSIPGSVAFVPSVAGMILAGEVIKDIAMSKQS